MPKFQLRVFTKAHHVFNHFHASLGVPRRRRGQPWEEQGAAIQANPCSRLKCRQVLLPKPKMKRVVTLRCKTSWAIVDLVVLIIFDDFQPNWGHKWNYHLRKPKGWSHLRPKEDGRSRVTLTHFAPKSGQATHRATRGFKKVKDKKQLLLLKTLAIIKLPIAHGSKIRSIMLFKSIFGIWIITFYF